MMTIKTITICAGLSFYKAIVPLEKELKKRGFRLKLPDSYSKMKRTGDFTPRKTWLTNADDYSVKGAPFEEELRALNAKVINQDVDKIK